MKVVEKSSFVVSMAQNYFYRWITQYVFIKYLQSILLIIVTLITIVIFVENNRIYNVKIWIMREE